MNHFSIPEPCLENWDNMQPNEQGRHCGSCSKTVLDVTHWSDERLVNEGSRREKGMCVRIQSDRLTSPPIRSKRRWILPLSIMLFFISIKNKIFGQSIKKEVSQDQAKSTADEINKIVIEGVVLDSLTDFQPMIGATVVVMNGDNILQGAVADFDGKFRIEIEDGFEGLDTLVLECKYVGFETIRKEIPLKELTETEFYMKEGHVCLKEAVIMKGKTIIMGGMTTGMIINRGGRRSIYMDNYDTKTYHSKDLERYNFGR